MFEEEAKPFREATISILSSAAQYLPVMTVLCASLGIMFDIGFFYKLGFGMFTFFSISEHLLFALETAPVFLVFICFIYVLGRFAIFLVSKMGGMSTAMIITSATMSVVAASLLWLLHRDLPGSIIGGVASALWLIFSAPISSLTRAAFIIASSFVVSFAFGIQSGINASNSSETLYRAETKSGTVYAGYPIRSGDRGVLFYDARDSEFRFLGWDQINLVSRVIR
jgi:hypothetical protein